MSGPNEQPTGADDLIYRGETLSSGRALVQVLVADGEGPLDPRHDLMNHSPDGFSWGYGGSGPAQLALALLAHALEDDNHALELYHDFKWAVIAQIKAPSWQIRRASIRKMCGLEP